MKPSLIICALICIVAALLVWRDKQQLSREKEAKAILMTEAAALPNDDARMAKAAAFPGNRLDRRQEDLAMKARVEALARDYFALFLNNDENPSAESADEFTKLQANIKSRLEELEPAGIKQFMEECYINPDLNLRIKRDINLYVRIAFISKYRGVQLTSAGV